MNSDVAHESSSSSLAMLLSFIWPGLGQLYQRRFVTGGLFLGGSLACTAVALLVPKFSNAGWGAVAVLALWSVYDVYRSRSNQ